VVFTKADSAIGSLSDVKGKKFMCVKKSSFGGYQMALRELRDTGINPETDCAKFIEGEKHDNVVLAVLNGVVEVGTVRTDTLERMQAEGTINISDFKIINKQSSDFPFVYSTRLYPEWPVAKCKATSDALADEVSKALTAMASDSDAAKTAKCVGWSKPLDYSDVVACMKELKLGAFAD
jgi:two-component system, LuxR family, sensor histidine kinase TtrS